MRLITTTIAAVLILFVAFWSAWPDANASQTPKLNNTIRAVAGEQPVVAFGVMSDIQAADYAPHVEKDRHYRRSPWRLADAVRILNDIDGLAFTIHCGDFVDDDPSTWDVLLPIWNQLAMPTHHVVGNHDIRARGTAYAVERMALERRYYSFDVNGWRFVVLDTNDLDAAQLDWLAGQLVQPCVVFGHHPEAFDTIAPIMSASGNAKVYFCGHNHYGGYREQDGVAMVNLHAMVNTPDSNAFAVVRIYADRIEVDGFGREPDRVLR